MEKTPLEIDLSVSTILGFVNNKYLDVATVSKSWGENYMVKSTKIDADTSFNNMVEYLQSGLPVSSRLTLTASELGRQDLFQLAVEHGSTVEHKSMTVAAKGVHLGILKYIDAPDSLCSMCVCKGASEGGQLGVLRWLFPGKQWLPGGMSKTLIRNAVIGGFLDIVVWAHECKWERLDSGLSASAAMHGHLGVVKYIHFNQSQRELGQYPKTALIHAAMRGDVETLGWLNDTATRGRAGSV